MTATTTAPAPAAEERRTRRWRGEPGWSRPALLAVLAVAALLYGWGLSAAGDANAYYSAAVKSGTQSWSAFFFGSLDAESFITVDKPPLALWVMGLFARVLGYGTWALLLPQVIAGVAAVAVLHATVRRASGPVAAIVAAAVLALTPITVAINRDNNPDTLLVLLLVGAAWAAQRAVERGRLRPLLLAAFLVGCGFNTKMLQAFLVVPALALVYLVAARPSLPRRLLHLLAAGVVLAVSSLWWMVVVDAIPASRRPFVGGSTDGTVRDLVLGYNGLGRIFGQGGGPGGRGGGGGFGGEPGALRMFNDVLGGQISWLLPFAVIMLVAGLALAGRRPRTDLPRAALLLWGGWLAVHAVVFSLAEGTLHPYYTTAMAPAIAALTGAGVALTGAGVAPSTAGAAPTSAGGALTGAGAVPSRADAVPSKADAALTGAGAVPTGAGAVPTGADAVPTGADAAPSKADAVPSRAGAALTGASAVPTGASAAPSKADAVPSRAGAALTGAGAVPSRADAAGAGAGAAPSKAGAVTLARCGGVGRFVLAVAVAVTGAWAFALLARTPDWVPWLRWVVVAATVVAVVGLLLRGRVRRLGVVAAGAALVAGLLGPAAYALSAASSPVNGTNPTAGPSSGGFGAPMGRGFPGTRRGAAPNGQTGGMPGPPPGGAAPDANGGSPGTPPGGAGSGGDGGSSGTPPGGAGSGDDGGSSGTPPGGAGSGRDSGSSGTPPGGTAPGGTGGSSATPPGGDGGSSGAPPGGAASGGNGGASVNPPGGGAGLPPGSAWSGSRPGGGSSGSQGRDGVSDRRGGGRVMGGPGGGLDRATVAYLRQNQGGARWLVAVPSAQAASSLILQTGEPVIAMGGFTGSDPAMTVAKLKAYAASGKLRFVQVGGGGGPGGGNAEVTAWVRENGTAVRVGGSTVTGLYRLDGAS
ncbi:glycosyltransferase family 39 protein [Actinomadura flavalba]|uniref:glycosyltransferase family 39 protein n=1 Tax=Actinomadura flavalba TaxID=1120938 RepID=UPI000362228E|nr:glycosyltransferase family 39 protein [Actinomadura flavalba]